MWINIENWEMYSVNEYGEVKNNKTNKLIVGDINNCGYYRVTLYHNKLHKRFFRHRLVAKYFISNPDNLPEVNHKDGDKSNNHYSNLEWCTRNENEQHCWANKLKKYNSGIIPNKPFVVTFNNGIVKEYLSQKSFAKDVGLSVSLIGDWLNNKSSTYYKYGIQSIKFINA